jgi:hypothetical protein
MLLLRELLELEEFIVENPQRIPALKLPQFEDLRSNKKLAKKILLWTPTAKLIETTSTGVKLYQQSKDKETEIYGIDEEDGLIVYYVRYEVQKADFIDVNWVTQVLVWRGRLSSPKTEGLPKHVFFDYVFPTEGVVVTDSQQTENGEEFWQRRIPDAFAKHLNVYLIDFHKKTVVKLKTKDDYAKLLNTKNDPWGATAWHKGIRLAISDFDLAQE